MCFQESWTLLPYEKRLNHNKSVTFHPDIITASRHENVCTALRECGHCGDALMEIIIVIFHKSSISQPRITWGTFRPMTSHHLEPKPIPAFKKWAVQCFSICPETKAKSSRETVANQKQNLGGQPGLIFHYSDSRLISNPVQPEQCNRFQSPLKPDGQWLRQVVLLCALESTAEP